MEQYREEFEKSIEKSGDCWVWIGRIGANGHAKFPAGDGKQISGRWLSWVLHGGMKSDHYFYATCRNPKCVNPDHLVPRQNQPEREEDSFGERLRKGHGMLEGDTDFDADVSPLEPRDVRPDPFSMFTFLDSQD